MYIRGKSPLRSGVPETGVRGQQTLTHVPIVSVYFEKTGMMANPSYPQSYDKAEVIDIRCEQYDTSLEDLLKRSISSPEGWGLPNLPQSATVGRERIAAFRSRDLQPRLLSD